MRKVTTALITSLQGLLGATQRAASPDSEFRLDEPRQAMLDALGAHGCSAYPALERKILFATDVEALWYVRSDMMAALSTLHGEFNARNMLGHITKLFDGLLPRGMTQGSSFRP